MEVEKPRHRAGDVGPVLGKCCRRRPSIETALGQHMHPSRTSQPVFSGSTASASISEQCLLYPPGPHFKRYGGLLWQYMSKG